MTTVQGPGGVSGPERIWEGLPQGKPPEKVRPVRSGDDTVEISEVARFKELLSRLPPIREELVARIREEIETGQYETEEKIQVTAQRILEELKEEGFFAE